MIGKAIITETMVRVYVPNNDWIVFDRFGSKDLKCGQTLSSARAWPYVRLAREAAKGALAKLSKMNREAPEYDIVEALKDQLQADINLF